MERDPYEVSNQLGGYVDPSTPEDLADFLLRESKHAGDLASELVEVRKERDRLRTVATDRLYMLAAYYNMLGENGRKVAQMWADKKIKRVHFDWGPEAHKLTGEERAKFILDLEDAPKQLVEFDNNDEVIKRTTPKIDFNKFVEEL